MPIKPEYQARMVIRYPTQQAVNEGLDKFSDMRLAGLVLTQDEKDEEKWLIDRDAILSESVQLEVQKLHVKTS